MEHVVDSGTNLAGATPERRVDLRGETCPTTSDETLRELERMASQEVLEVVSDYYPARTTIPYHCDKRGYRYVLLDGAGEEEGRDQPVAGSGRPVWRIRIQKS